MPYIKRDTLKELFELCDIDSPAALSGAAKVEITTARVMFKRMKDEDFIRVNRGTLNKLCDALTAYPDELTGDDVVREMHALLKMKQRFDEMDPGALICIDLRFEDQIVKNELIHRCGADFVKSAGIKRYIAYIHGDSTGACILTDASGDADFYSGRWHYGDVKVRPLMPNIARSVVRAVAADEKVRKTVWVSRIESGARIGEK